MKIGIVTIQKCDNFGADLQAYALQRKLRLMGYDAENIDYLFYKHPRHLGCKGEKPIFRLSLVNRAKEFLFPIVSGVKALKHRRAMKQRRARFAAWTDLHLKCGREYRSVAALYSDPPRYDVYMVGSDQVWNPRIGSNILPYFLDFAPVDAKCVSYASSFGVSELPAGVFYRYKQLLKRFSAIGLREEAGADMIRAMALGVEVKHVIDPTLLLSAAEWEPVSCEVENAPVSGGGGYVLLYDLKESPETVSLARRWAQERGLKVLRVGDLPIGPGEFVWLIAHAHAVVTNSFHGTAFAVNYAKPFVSVIPRGMNNASRIESLLKSLGLMDRVVKAADAASFDLSREISFDVVQPKLAALRSDSIAFLKRAIDEPAQKISHKLPLGCYAVWNVDEKARAASTSGGLFRVLAERTIAHGGVVYGAAFTADFHRVVHQSAETMEALDPLMKSKYVWSDPTAAYGQAVRNLRDGREVLFVGTPCQIAAIKALAKGVDENLMTVDIVCHGTPRPEIFTAYVEELERRFGGKVTRYEFRNKKTGWNFPHVTAEFSQGGGGMI